jgi:Leucine-rich repeat (LRR) protein
MAAPIPGEQFVRTLRHYLEANQSRLLFNIPHQRSQQAPQPPQTPQAPQKPQPPTEATANNGNGIFKTVSSLWSNSPPARPSSPTPPNSTKESIISSRPTSLYGIPIPYMSLLAATSPNATSLSNTPYMPIRSSLTLDIHYLYFLLVQFEYLGLEETHLPVPAEHGLVETETTQSAGQAPSVVSSVGSMMSTLSLSTGWQFWNNKEKQTERPLHEDIVWIHRYLQNITALKLHMTITTTDKGITRSGQRTIRGYEQPLPQDGSISLPLDSFKNLKYLELSHIHPTCISNWSELKNNLVSLGIKVGNVDNAVDIIGQDTEWPQLKMLSLADNSLTTMESEPANLVRNLTHLNLSSNLLIDIPVALASLYNLTSLNLSYNMISFTTGINTVLGNIQELDLRGNRLTLLAGLDRLWALERLDVRDNRIDDATEIGRLTALPNIQDIWVEGNPFTKLQVSELVCLNERERYTSNNALIYDEIA